MADVDAGDRTDSDVEENLGILRPTVLDQIKEILREYRNDVQIIKELIQNADDAGATQMKILYQARCLNPEQEGETKFRKFLRAPALVFYNDSVFSEENWKGVRSIYTSEKAHDPLKIGRFGLGFKSIFHMTDFPAILSGEKIMFINPGEQEQKRICTRIPLKKLKRSKNLRVSDLLEGFNDLFGFSEANLDSGYYHGTLFWFPLRKKMSQLSDTIYSEEEVRNLLDSFIEESDKNILFANTVSKIEVFIDRSDEETNMENDLDAHHSESILQLQKANFGKHIAAYTVQIDNASETLIKERRELRKRLIPLVKTIPEITEHWSFDVFVRCNKRMSKEETKESRCRWLIVNYLKGGELTEHTHRLMKEDLGYHHLVAIAGRIKEFDNEENDTGRVFCNQPLPHDNQTGLPVFINAQFALGNNRRQIKWEDRESLVTNTDKEIKWNHALVSEILPHAYLVLLQEMIKLSKRCKNEKHIVDSTYTLIPDIRKADDRWKELAIKFVQLTETENLFYTQDDNQWIGSREAILLPDCEQYSETISTLLMKEGLPFARIPKNVDDSLTYFTSEVQKMSPEFLRQHMLKNRTYKNMTFQQKEHLLLYLKTVGIECTAIDKLELIPLADGSFTCTGGTDIIFVESEDVVRLFPGKLSKFVSTDLQPETMDIIQSIAVDGSSGLQILDAGNAADLIGDVLQNNFGLGKLLTLRISERSFWKQWLENVWTFIQLRFKETFDSFALLPIYPFKCESEWDTAVRIELCSLSSLVMYYPNCETKKDAEAVSHAFELLSVNIVRKVPHFISTFLTDTYITNDQSTKIAHLFERVSSEGIKRFNAHVCCEKQHALLRYISQTIHTELTPNCIKVLKKIRIFRQEKSSPDSEYSCVSINENQSFFKKQYFPVKFYKQMVVITNDSELILAKKLGAEVFDVETLTLQTLTEAGQYTTQDVRRLVAWIIKDTILLNNQEIVKLIKRTKFIQSVNGQWREPSYFFDPQDELITKLFKNEDVLPNVSGEDNLLILQKLKDLGMKSRKNITKMDVVKACQTIHTNASKSDEKDYEKAEALLEFLNLQPTIVEKTYLCNMKVVPVDSFSQDNYPLSLELKSRGFNKKLCKPSEVRSLEYVHLIGSVYFVMDCTKVIDFAKEHGLSQPPEVNDVILHFENVLKSYRIQSKAAYVQMISKIYEWFSENKQLRDTKNRPLLDNFKKPNDHFIWNGNDFVSPDNIYIDSSEENFEDLNTVMSKLPTELNHLKEFFSALGCQQRPTFDMFVKALERVKERSEAQNGNTNKASLRKMAITILNKVKDYHITDVNKTNIYFPVNESNSCSEMMKPVNECVYCENDEFRTISLSRDLALIHPDVPIATAKALGVPNVRRSLLSKSDFFEKWGQEESLAVQIYNIIKHDYEDGFAVIKELFQNAEDAGANHFFILYDERENKDACASLISDHMSECQGPAFWVFNDAKFSENDFSNIKKLGIGTKRDNPEKIGKFGHGFCAVYNITDVPSILSGSNLIIFDPQTTYLDTALPQGVPGVRINLVKEGNLDPMHTFSDQFKPYQNVFGCDLLKTDQRKFPGTLFRLPLRTKTSQISDNIYTKSAAKNLMGLVKEFSSNLFLFNNSIHTIKLFHLQEHESDPSNQKLVFEAKAKKRYVPNMTDIGQGTSIVKEVNRRITANPQQTEALNQLQEVDITAKIYDENCKCKGSTTTTKWILSWASKTSEALAKIISTNRALLPLGSIALPVQKIQDSHLVTSANNPCPLRELLPHFYHKGHFFSIIPTPHFHNFMFHINGHFQLSLDRKLVISKTGESQDSKDTQWNELLICYPIVSALMFLFENIQMNQMEAFQIWPKKDDSTDDLSKCLVESFYKNISHETERPIFEYFGKKVCLSQCLFLDPDLREDESVGDIAFAHLLQHSDKCVIDIPRDIYSLLDEFNTNLMPKMTVCTESFILDYFLEYLDFLKITPGERNSLLRFSLFHDTKTVKNCLREIKCIPTDDGCLKLPTQIVDPKSKYARLFLEGEGFFPEIEFVTQEIGLLEKLRTLGMQNDTLSDEAILNRVDSIIDDQISCSECIIDRALYLMEYLCENFDISDAMFEKLKRKPFLPIMLKPEKWPFPWYADNAVVETKGLPCEKHTSAKQFVLLGSPYMLYSSEFSDLVSIHQLVFDKNFCDRLQEKCSSNKCEKCFSKLGILGISDKTQHVGEVVLQLLAITEFYDEACKNKETIDMMECVLRHVYIFLEKFSNAADLEGLKDIPIIWVKDSFIIPGKVSSDNAVSGCQPYLFSVRESAISICPKLWTSLEIVEHFYANDVANILENIAVENFEFARESQVDAWLNLLYLLKNRLKEEHIENIDAFLSKEGNISSIYMPDENGVLRKCSDLCLNDAEEIEKTPTMKYVHERIPLALAKSFNVKEKKLQRLEESCEGIEFFFQEELLCTRLRQLVDGFSTDSSIFKEILQNADDAKASEVIFIKDFNTYSTDTVFDERFSPLQGPALCVYNDRCFSDEDLRGITRIGVGSKSTDPSKIGKFGIGFNAVYYITDAPSFYSIGTEIENDETLCIFDPLASFLPNVTTDKPGKRYKDLDWIRKNHPDVLKGYHEDMFQGEKEIGTIFRFPLRIKPSDIKKEIMNLKDLSGLLDDFCKELKHSLIFLRHVKNVRVCSYENGKYQDDYFIETVMTNEDLQQQKYLVSELNSMCADFDKQRSIVLDMKQQTFEYTICFRETFCDRCISSSYQVIQTVGFDPDLEIPKVVEEGYKNGRITVLPEGGIAFKQQAGSIISEGKLFCLIPLPVSTGLPAHVNGHFVLDYGTRRSLFKSENEDTCYKTQWNLAIIEHVIAKSYVEYLQKLHSSMFEKDFTDGYTDEKDILSSLDRFFSHFPMYDHANDIYWKLLTNKIYSRILTARLPFLPVLQKKFENEDGDCSLPLKLSWTPISLGHSKKIDVYQNEADLQDTLVTILRHIGMRIADIPENIKDSFRKCEIKFETLCPKHVIEYLSSFNEKETENSETCSYSNQPIHVTRFEKYDYLKPVLCYCLKDIQFFLEKFTSLPIFITQDGILRKLSESNRLFVTEFTDFFPGRLHRFAHKSIYNPLHEDLVEDSNGLLVNFTIKDFVEFASNDGIFGKIEQTEQPWHDDYQETEMIEKFWLFFKLQLTNNKPETVKESLEVMKDLKLLPVIDPMSGKRKLITPGESSSLIDLDSFQVGTKLHKLITQFYISELDKNIFKFDVEDNDKNISLTVAEVQDRLHLNEMCKLLLKQIPNVEEPEKIIHCLANSISKNHWTQLDSTQASLLLKYFSDRKSMLQNKPGVLELKKIPMFVTQSEKIISIDTRQRVVLLPTKIPKSGLDLISKVSDVIFLRDMDVKDLYYLLDISCLCKERVYTEFIFPYQYCMSREEFMDHIVYLCKDFSVEDRIENNMILRNLNDLSFIEVGPRNFVQVRDTFYDRPRRKEFFKLFCKKHELLPNIYHKTYIIEVFEKLGLHCDMEIGLFERFANEIASAQYSRSSEKATVLVNLLFKMGNNFHRNCNFTRLSYIPFILPVTFENALCLIHKPFNTTRKLCFADSVLYEKVDTCWTTANILPKWADPIRHGADELICKLRICTIPNENQIFAHCKNIGNVLKDGLPHSVCEHRITEVMEKVYDALNETSAYQSCYDSLKHTPIIYFPKRKVIKAASSVTMDCSAEEEIEPYLLKMPQQYGKFETLFLKLGSLKEPNVFMYADVIETIRHDSGLNVSSSQKDALVKAMTNIFRLLKKQKSQVHEFKSLYLLSDDNVLTEAKDLVIVNNRYLQKRLQKGLKLNYMANLEDISFLGIRIDEIVDSLKMLPENHRPLILTDIVKEEVDMTRVTNKDSKISTDFMRFLHDQLFVTAVCRLARHGIRNQLHGEWNTEIENDITELILNIEMRHVEGIRTDLTLNGGTVEETSESKEVHLHVIDNKTVVYFDTEGSSNWYSDVSNEIILRLKECHACLEDKLLFTAQKIFMCRDPNKCEEILDREGIEAYKSTNIKSLLACKEEIENKPYQLYPEAERWQRQAKCDLENARESLSLLKSTAYNWICYKTHQASEKSLKAAWYATDANKMREFGESHCLHSIAQGLLTDLSNYAEQLTSVTGWHTRMRYPSGKIPSDIYSRSDAENTVRIAGCILEEVDTLLLQNKQSL